MATKDYNPNITIHPGVTLKELLENLNMTQTDLAERTGLTPKTINEIIQEKNPISPETSLKLSAVFGMSPAFWNNLERNYQETMARIERDKKLEKELPFLQKFHCYKDLTKWKYIPEASDQKEKVLNLLNFFGVSSLEFVQKTYQVAFRQSKQKNLSNECLAAWLRCGEIDGIKIETKPFDRDKLMSSIESLRALTNKGATEIEKKLQKVCAEFGVAVAFVPYFSNTYVDGATRWLSTDKALIQVSLRGAHIDRFWFTFFHEIGHLLKHGKKDQFVEFEDRSNRMIEVKEREADEFASKTLIPESEFQQFVSSGKVLSDDGINSFAKKINISPAIIAGRIAHELSERGSKNAWKRFSHLRTRLHFVNS
ncbi:MAG: HigA family addiction module antidote protein [Candidatus Staskawiczbacteria bacterium]|nr:HigA family addiction module antidote protein [Candidatus Staskawiczbacteria bacterium]